jgi:hypothetical protein
MRPEHFVAVHARHVEVEHEQVVARRLQPLLDKRAVVGLFDLPPVAE